jgi:hypothetical protein
MADQICFISDTSSILIQQNGTFFYCSGSLISIKLNLGYHCDLIDLFTDFLEILSIKPPLFTSSSNNNRLKKGEGQQSRFRFASFKVDSKEFH